MIVPHQLFIPFDPVLEQSGALRDLLRRLHVVPEPVGGGFHVQLLRLPFHLGQADGAGQILDLGIEPLQPLPQFFKL